MAQLQLSLHSSIGRKFWVAISGLALLGFVISHLSGNLIVYGGQDAFNQYGQTLKDFGPLLWVARGGVLFFFLMHVILAVRLSLENKCARNVAYQKKTFVAATLPSRTMLVSGLTLLAFILYHLAHFTFHCVHNTGPHVDSLGRADIFTMLVLGFQNPMIVSIYLVAMCFLALHLSHAVHSVLQTFGLEKNHLGKCAKKIGPAFAFLIFVGYASIPISVWLGIIKLPGGATP